MTLPFGFTAPEHASIGTINLGALIADAARGNETALASVRMRHADEVDSFDRFVAAVRVLIKGDHVKAADEFARFDGLHWQMPATALCALATAAAGDCRGAIKIANQMSDRIFDRHAVAFPIRRHAVALHKETIRCIKLAEASLPVVSDHSRLASRPRYVIGYPRSGSTMLTQFLSFAFAAPRYTVYAAASRYFSKGYHEPAPGHAVFVKDHILHPEYAEDAIVSPIRDGRDVMVSLARYLYVEDGSPFIQRGELADFLSYVAGRMPYGFWATHTRALLAARDRGVNIRIVRYEELFRNYQGLLTLARDLADGWPVACEDQAEYLALVAHDQRMDAVTPLPEPFPDDSFIPGNWTVGGGTIHWRRAFDRPARRRFHELGGTELLLRLGYETDEDWWRHE